MLILQKGWIAPRLMLYLMGRYPCLHKKKHGDPRIKLFALSPTSWACSIFQITFIASFKDILHIGQIINITLFFV